MGDWNAIVGSATGDEDTFTDILGRWGVGVVNDAGNSLLECCATHGLCVAATYFRHKNKHRYTHRHHATRNYKRAIDHVLVRRKFLTGVKDVRVYRGGNTDGKHSDHQLLVMTYCLRLKEYETKKIQSIQSLVGNTELQQAFIARCDELYELSTVASDIAAGNLEGAWNGIGSITTTAAKDVLPEINISWHTAFTPDSPELALLNLRRDKIKASLSRCRGSSARALGIKKKLQKRLKKIKKEISNLAKTVQREHLIETGKRLAAADGAGHYGDKWSLFKEITGHGAGKKSSRNTGIRDDAGTLLLAPSEQAECLSQYMAQLYNCGQHVDQLTLQTIPPITPEHDEDITDDDILSAMLALKKKKAADALGVTAEHLQYSGRHVTAAIQQVIHAVMQQGLPPTAKRSDLIALPKSGDPQLRENKRGIQLISMLRKIISTWLGSKLTATSDSFLSDTQCGFRPGRGCLDNLFILRTLIEEARLRQLPDDKRLHVIFVDLRKAFDSVDRQALIAVLKHRGIPSNLVRLAEDMHTDTTATVRVQGVRAAPFNIEWGVQQGCPASCPLFNIFMDVISKDIAEMAGHLGVKISWTINGRLVPSVDGSHSNSERVIHLLLADDLTLVAETDGDAQELLSILAAVMVKWKMKVNTLKTKIMIVDQPSTSQPQFVLGQTVIEVVEHNKYLGSYLSNDGSLDKELAYRISSAVTALIGLKKLFKLPNDAVSPAIKAQFYRSLVLSRLLYGAGTWNLSAQQEQKLHVFHTNALRSIIGVTRLNHVALETLYRRTQTPPMAALLQQQRLRLLGQIGRLDDSRLSKRVLHCSLEGPRRVGQFSTLRKTLEKDVIALLGRGGQSVGRRWDRDCQNVESWNQRLRDLLQEAFT